MFEEGSLQFKQGTMLGGEEVEPRRKKQKAQEFQLSVSVCFTDASCVDSGRPRHPSAALPLGSGCRASGNLRPPVSQGRGGQYRKEYWKLRAVPPSSASTDRVVSFLPHGQGSFHEVENQQGPRPLR